MPLRDGAAEELPAPAARTEGETFVRLAQALAADRDPARLVQAATDAAVQLTGAASGAFVAAGVNQPDDPAPPLPRPSRTPALVAPTDSAAGSVHLDDVATDPRVCTDPPDDRMPVGHLPARSSLAVPVVSGSGEVLGDLVMRHPEPGVFTERAARLVAGVAAQLAIALDNARLEAAERAVRADAERATARARHLQQLTGQLSRSLEVDEILAGIARSAAELLNVPVGAVFLLDPDEPEGDFTLAAASGIAAERTRELRLPRHASLAGQAIDQGQTLIVNDVSQTPGTALPALLTGETAGSEIAAPITAGPERLGVIKAFSLVIRRFNDDDGALLKALADAAAVALTNARLYRQVQDSLRLRDEFLSAAAHDLKTPLTAMKGMAQLLRRRVARGSVADADTQRLRDGLTSIDTAATQMGAQLDELLDLTRLQMGQPLELQRQPTDLVVLARQVVAEQQQTAARHRLRLEALPSQLVGAWDAARLVRVLNNLIGNAVKYSPEGGEVIVTLTQEGAGAAARAVLTVQDQGLGIPAADLPRIFERFQRAGNVGSIAGTGIGLASAWQIVEQHEGTIDVESQEGAGSTFRVRLPLGPAADAPR